MPRLHAREKRPPDTTAIIIRCPQPSPQEPVGRQIHHHHSSPLHEPPSTMPPKALPTAPACAYQHTRALFRQGSQRLPHVIAPGGRPAPAPTRRERGSPAGSGGALPGRVLWRRRYRVSSPPAREVNAVGRGGGHRRVAGPSASYLRVHRYTMYLCKDAQVCELRRQIRRKIKEVENHRYMYIYSTFYCVAYHCKIFFVIVCTFSRSLRIFN